MIEPQKSLVDIHAKYISQSKDHGMDLPSFYVAEGIRRSLEAIYECTGEWSWREAFDQAKKDAREILSDGQSE